MRLIEMILIVSLSFFPDGRAQDFAQEIEFKTYGIIVGGIVCFGSLLFYICKQSRDIKALHKNEKKEKRLYDALLEESIQKGKKLNEMRLDYHKLYEKCEHQEVQLKELQLKLKTEQHYFEQKSNKKDSDRDDVIAEMHAINTALQKQCAQKINENKALRLKLDKVKDYCLTSIETNADKFAGNNEINELEKINWQQTSDNHNSLKKCKQSIEKSYQLKNKAALSEDDDYKSFSGEE
jgi:hypothetical protein